MLFVSNYLFGIYFYPVNFSLLLVCTFHSIFYYLFWICRCLCTLISNLEDKIFTLKTWLFISELVKFRHEAALFAIGIIFFFLKTMGHLLKINKNKNFKNLRLWDSEGLKLDSFWIFTEISKNEQLYLLFTSIKTSVHASLKVLWMFLKEIYSFMYSYDNYWMLFLLKNREKLKLSFFHFIPFSASP